MESNIDAEMKYINGEIEVELIPAGTLAEKIRSGGVGKHNKKIIFLLFFISFKDLEDFILLQVLIP